MGGYGQQHQRTPGKEFAVPQAWYVKVLEPDPGWEKKEKKSLFCVCVHMGSLASYIKKVAAIPPQYSHIWNAYLGVRRTPMDELHADK